MGKSAASRYFTQLHIPVHDSDESVHRLMLKDGPIYNALKNIIPEAITEKAVNRQILSQEIRRNPDFLKQLEAIIHPEVRIDRNRFILRQMQLGQKLVVLDVPLLFEAGWYKNCHKIALVDCPLWLQKQRILARGISEEKMNILLKRQWPQSRRKCYADYIIRTGLSFATSRKDIRLLLKDITQSPNPPFPSGLTFLR